MLVHQGRNRRERSALDKLSRVVFRRGDDAVSIYEAFPDD